jgi:hypothetical protein
LVGASSALVEDAPTAARVFGSSRRNAKIGYLMPRIEPKHLTEHETKRKAFYKFLLIFVLFLGYFGFVSFHYGAKEGFLVAALTWSFFVLCTPIADAGFLIDFPLRLICNVRMFVAEIAVWVVAISLNVWAFAFRHDVYQQTKSLQLFERILREPFPFWLIILLSAVGTFLSVSLGDQLMDKVEHHEVKVHKWYHLSFRTVLFIFVIVATLVLYDFLLKRLGVAI